MNLKEKIMQELELVENSKTGIPAVDRYNSIPIILLKTRMEEKISFSEMKLAIKQLDNEGMVLLLKNDDAARCSAEMTYGVNRIIISNILRDAVEFALQCLDDKIVVVYGSVPQMERLF